MEEDKKVDNKVGKGRTSTARQNGSLGEIVRKCTSRQRESDHWPWPMMMPVLCFPFAIEKTGCLRWNSVERLGRRFLGAGATQGERFGPVGFAFFSRFAEVGADRQ